MIKMLVTRSRSIHWKRIFSVLLIVALLMPLMVMVPAPDAPLRVQPVLLHMAAERPEATVGVIVQTLGREAGVEQLVARMGGLVTKDLWIINAFAAELPAGAVTELARAAGVRWVSLDASVVQAGEPIDTSDLVNAYVQAIGADQVWNEAPYLQGQGITAAIVDSGVDYGHSDLADANNYSRVLTEARFNSFTNNNHDKYGHGTHVAGTIGGNGLHSNERYIGVAPKVNLVNVKVSDDTGKGTTSDAVEGLQWIYENKDVYNIRVVNLSLNSSVAESYHTSPLDAALEILWFNRIVVVVSAGNNGDGDDNGILYPPANDPFVITVGAVDDMDTAETSDDTLAPFSAYGTTEEGYAKPDIVAPGTDIISLLPVPKGRLWREHPTHRVTDAGPVQHYFRMSGTSMASAVTTGAVVLLLQDEPDLTPAQVKYRLMATAQPFDTPERAGAGYLDIYAAVHDTTTESANAGIEASQLLWKGSGPVAWNSVNWDSVNWDSVNWDSVNWDSVNWDSVNWDSVIWDD